MSTETTESAVPSFRKSYPIDFRLFDNDDHPVLYITDAPTQEILHLEIINTSRRTINLNAPDSEANNNHHFKLKFRPGVLSSETPTVMDNNWTLTRQPAPDDQPAPDGMVSLFFCRKTADTLAPNQRIQIKLTGISANGQGGARGTQVELICNDKLVQYGTKEPIHEHRIHHLSIVNHRGRKQIPLHVGFVGSNTILNDGTTENSLTLHITNVMKEDPAYKKRSTISFTPESKFVISFDVFSSVVEKEKCEDKEWALGTKSQVEKITINNLSRSDLAKSQPLISGWTMKIDNESEIPEWTLTPSNASTELSAGEHIELTLGKIISSCPTGQTKMYVHYKNIPGYWDGQFVVMIEKSPLLYRGQNVGIGVTAPEIHLAIRDSKTGLKHEDGNELALYTNSKERVRIDRNGNVGIGTQTPKERLVIEDSNLNSVVLLFRTKDKPSGSKTFDAIRLKAGWLDGNNAWRKQRLSIQGAQKEKTEGEETETDWAEIMTIKADGNVGIGTNDPKTKLDVNGVIKANNLKIGNTTINESELQVLKHLANDQLTVKIVSAKKGYVLDNYYKRVSDGDRDRTIQFQYENSAGDSALMRLKIVK